ncbi:MAG: cytochrome d ubiquinol oxidase subunit II [Balneolaceae bacterium]
METFLGLDYNILWFLVVGAVFSGYAILDGFDLGAGALHLFIKGDKNRRIAFNAIGPVWDGNEVWLVIGGGTLFAGFPEVYASLFSAFYIPFMLFLTALIFRAVAIEFRSKEKMTWWRTMWDISYAVSSILLAVLLGVMLGNILQGIPLSQDHNFYGSWLTFLNPFSITVGITTLILFMMHGAMYLSLKTEGKLFNNIQHFLRNTVIAFVIIFIILSFYILLYEPHLTIKFKLYPQLFVIPLLIILSIANITRLVAHKKYFPAFIFSGITIALLLILSAINLYPNIIVSTINPAYSLDIYNAASSQKSLGIMLTITLIGAPLAVFYALFAFWTFRGKVKLDEHSY